MGGDETPAWIFVFPSEFFETISHGYVFGVRVSNRHNEKILYLLHDVVKQGQTLFAWHFIYPGSVLMAFVWTRISQNLSFLAHISVCVHFLQYLSKQITSLGGIIDSTLTFNQYIIALSRACYFHLCSLRHIRRSLTDDMAISIAVARVQSRLDYCNSLLFGISAFNIHKLQRVQNLAARLTLNFSAPAHSHPLKLYWFPIQSRIKFKISS